MSKVTRGIRNNNPFNIRYSTNSWLGKVKYSKNTDKVFEQFRDIDYGLRAGILLLRGYIKRGYDTPKLIINRFAPPSENNTVEYIHWLYTYGGLTSDVHITFNSFAFYKLCEAVCMYESGYHLTVEKFCDVCKRFSLSNSYNF